MIDDDTCEMLIYNSLICWKSFVTNPNCLKARFSLKREDENALRLGLDWALTTCPFANYETSLVTAIRYSYTRFNIDNNYVVLIE